MNETAIDRFGELVGGAMLLNPDSFRLALTLPLGGTVAVGVVLLAGLSRAIGQGTVLFVNRVKPFRFVLSLLIAAVLFAIGVIFWMFSTWMVSRFMFGRDYAAAAVIRTLALAHAPQLLNVFVALPYLGVPVSVVLSVWSFLAVLVGMQATLNLGIWQAVSCTALGWIVVEILERTIGRPVAAIGYWLANRTAGVKLVTDLKDIEQLVETGIQRSQLRTRDRQSRR
jgi:hypothetical protein